MIELWRLERLQHIETTFTGKGSQITGGRWNAQGDAVMYTAQNLALACLEILVHFPCIISTADPDHVDRPLVTREIIHITIDETQLSIEEVSINMLPNNWRAIHNFRQSQELTPLQRIGKNWLKYQSTAILKVPSAVIPQEHSYLINPNHPDVKSRFKLSSQTLGLIPDLQLNDIEIKHEGKLFFDDRLLVNRTIEKPE